MAGGGSQAGPIAWDGYARVDYVIEAGRRPERGRLQVNLMTVEATTEANVRPGMRVGFVTGDPDGPPTFIGVRISRGRLPRDVRELLGASLATVADDVVTGPTRSRWARLNLRAVDALADAWAPYRDLVLAGASPPGEDENDPPATVRRAGTWQHGLWALLAADELRQSMTDLAASGAFNLLGGSSRDGRDEPDGAGDETADPWEVPAEASGRWPVPPELARRAAIEPELVWEIRARKVHVLARPAAGAAESTAQVCFDDGTDRWVSLLPDPGGTLRAVIGSAADPERLPAVRIRVTDPEAGAS